jgi:hypothetical protein
MSLAPPAVSRVLGQPSFDAHPAPAFPHEHVVVVIHDDRDVPLPPLGNPAPLPPVRPAHTQAPPPQASHVAPAVVQDTNYNLFVQIFICAMLLATSSGIFYCQAMLITMSSKYENCETLQLIKGGLAVPIDILSEGMLAVFPVWFLVRICYFPVEVQETNEFKHTTRLFWKTMFIIVMIVGFIGLGIAAGVAYVIDTTDECKTDPYILLNIFFLSFLTIGTILPYFIVNFLGFIVKGLLAECYEPFKQSLFDLTVSFESLFPFAFPESDESEQQVAPMNPPPHASTMSVAHSTQSIEFALVVPTQTTGTETCPVCCEESEPDKVFRCNHFVCPSCRLQLQQRKFTKCPLCRGCILETPL